MMRFTEKTLITTHILLTISRSKCNHKMKLCQLMKHKIKKLFMENATQYVMEKLVRDSILKSRK